MSAWRTDPVLRRAVGSEIAAGAGPAEGSVARVVGSRGPTLGLDGAALARSDLLTEHLGLGPLGACAEDPDVTDVLVNGDGRVWVDGSAGLRETAVRLDGPAEVRALACRLAGLAGRRLDESQPWVDGQLAPGVRLHAVLPPVAVDGPCLSLRLAARRAATLDGLVARGTLTPGTARLLRRVVGARVSFLVSGATGAGKTTLLGALLREAPPGERLVVVEDVAELRLDHPHVVALQGRAANVEGVGAVSVRDLVRQALRMRADRLVVGEARGPEVVDLLAALNTGHAGAGTIHANAAADVPARCVALGATAGQEPAAVLAQLRTAVRCVVHVTRESGARRVTEIGVVVGDEVRPAWRRDGPADEGAAGELERLVGARPVRPVPVPASGASVGGPP